MPSLKPARRKGELTRQDLLAAARATFGRVGYARAEISQIAREAGKSIGVFYIYFENKDEVLRTLVTDFVVELRETLTGPLNPPEAVSDVVAALWRIYRKHAATFVALTEAAASHPEFAEMSASLRNFAQRDYVNMVLQRQQAGHCLHLDAQHTGAALEVMINYCLYEWLARSGIDAGDERQSEAALASLMNIARAVLELPPRPITG